MVFALHLEDERVPEWHNYYVNYARLKGWIHEVETCGSAAAAEQFFEELTLSFRRIDGFYNSKEDDLLSRFEKMLDGSAESDEGADDGIQSIEKEMDKLRSYAEVNQEALKNIANKFDQHTGACSPHGKDGSQKIAGQSADWGGLSQPLGPRVEARLSTYRFGNAAERIDGMSNKFEAWKSGTRSSKLQVQDLQEPFLLKRSSTLAVILKAPSKAQHRLGVAHAHIGSVVYFVVISAIVVGLAAGKVASDTLDTRSYVVIWVTAITLTLLVWQWPSDAVMLGATLFLNLSGLIDAKEAWGGFSNEVVLSVAALSVVGDIVSRTGFVDILFAKVIGQPKSLAIAHLKILIPCAMGAATMSNTAVMACCMSAIEDWSHKSGYHTALFFMPISYLMLIAGTIAIFSTSTNMVAQAQLVDNGLPPFGTFDLAGPALACTIVSLIYLVVATPIVLRRFQKKESLQEDVSQRSDAKHRHWYARVQVQSQTYHGKTLRDSGLLAILPHGFQSVMTVERYSNIIERQPSPEFVLGVDDIMELRVRSMTIELLRDFPGIHLLALGASEVEASSTPDARELAEVCLDRDSKLVGKKLAAAKTYDEFGASIVGYRVRDENWTSTCETSFTLSYGDQMVLDVPAGFCKKLGSHSAQFLSVRHVGGKPKRHEDNSTAYRSGAILGVMLVFMALSIVPLFPCVLAAIFALVVTGCSSVDGAKKAVPLKVVFTIVGAFGLGKSIGKHGVAAFLGSSLVSMCSPFGQLGLLVAVAVAVAALGVIFHGTAVVALMFPTCVSVAQAGGIPIHQMIAVLCLSVACQMLSPVSYNTNLMAYAACPEYQFKDFVLLGAPLVGLILLVAIPMCQLWFPE